MKTAIATLKSISSYSQSKFHMTEKLPKELHDDYEKRTWRERCNYMSDGRIFIPMMAFKNAISDVARFLGEQIPGRGKSTWTKHFMSGILVEDNLVLPTKKDDVEGEWIFCPADGKRGGGSRVLKCFPIIREWQGDVTYYVLDDMITEDVFLHHLEEAGRFIGVGRFRPQNGGYYGRFQVKDIVWS